MPAHPRVPDVQVLVNGAPLPPAALGDLSSVSVQEDLDAVSAFALELYNWDADAQQVSWSDSSLFRLGAAVEIRMGYVGELGAVLDGEVTGLEPVFSGDSPPMLVVRGHDRRHRLARGRHTRSYAQMKDSDIARKIAGDNGLRAVVTDTRQTHPHVLQLNLSDLAFLRQRARLLGYEIFVRGTELHFRPPRLTGAPVATLTVGADLSEFRPRLSGLQHQAGTEVHGWDPLTKKEIRAKARPTATPMGASSGIQQVARAFGADVVALAEEPVTTAAIAQAMADGRHLGQTLNFVRGEGEGDGNPKLRAGELVAVNGAGRTFSGTYYLSSVHHELLPRTGYTTRFEVRRSGT